MLSGRMETLDVQVFKCESVDDLWGGDPIVFRLVTLPRVLRYLVRTIRSGHPFAFVVLGNTGDRLDLLNERDLCTADDPVAMEGAAYAAQNIMWGNRPDAHWPPVMLSMLFVLQTIVWCLQGASVELVRLGEHGETAAAWEIETDGPRVEGVRAIAFEDRTGSGD